MLPTEAIQEFIEIHKKNTGITLSEKDASIIAQRFFDGIQILFTQKDVVETELN